MFGGCVMDIKRAIFMVCLSGVLMDRIISYCGITCSDCPTYKATRMNDDAERKRVAELWTKQYGHPFKAEDINCDGCLTKGTRVFNYTRVYAAFFTY